MDNIYTWWKMKILKKVGFFPSRPSEQAVLALKALTRKEGRTAELQILAYLDAGHKFLVDAGIARDWLAPKHPVIGVPNVLTDGEWAWTSDVIHYVKKYHMELPAEFVAHMESNHWFVPPVENFKELGL